MTLLLALPAFAEPQSTAFDAAETCASRSVVHVAPADGATDVPLDARLAVLLAGDGCGDPPATLRLEDGEGLVLEVFDPELEPVRGGALVEVWPEGGLQPDTDYVLTYEAFDVHVSSFRTGLAVEEGEPSAPEVDVQVAASAWIGHTLTAELGVTATGTPGAMLWVAERLGAEPRVVVFDPQGQATTGFGVQPPSNVDELCVVVAQQGSNGALSDWVEACTPFEAPPKPEEDSGSEGKGCATVPGPAGLLLGLLALPLVRRRR